MSDATDAVSDIMSALSVAAGFKPAGRTGRRPVFREAGAGRIGHQRADPVGPTARWRRYSRHTKVSLRGAIFREIRDVRISITNYLDVMSSWCFWSQPTWAELKRRYADRVEFDWKISLMDGAGLPKSRAQEEWYYRRSGLMNRSPFMLRSDSYEPVLPEYLAPNLVAEAARDLGIKDDSVRLALSNPSCARDQRHS